MYRQRLEIKCGKEFENPAGTLDCSGVTLREKVATKFRLIRDDVSLDNTRNTKDYYETFSLEDYYRGGVFRRVSSSFPRNA